LLLEQTPQLGTSLVDERSRKLTGGLLAFGRQVLDPEIQQRNISLEPAQSFLNAGDTIRRRKHGSGSPVSLQIATAMRGRKLPTEYLENAGEIDGSSPPLIG
jgi:hypothetical protein